MKIQRFISNQTKYAALLELLSLNLLMHFYDVMFSTSQQIC